MVNSVPGPIELEFERKKDNNITFFLHSAICIEQFHKTANLWKRAE